ncbi:MAG TPA: hypothetical protein VGM81_14565 [Burkholderiaceae bacterium]|jgi:hypothetical protein
MINTYDNKYFAVFLAGIIGIFGAVGFEIAQADAPTAVAAQEIIKLDRVEIVGKRVVEQHAIAKLPRVVIEGRRMALAEDEQMAGGKSAAVKVS